MKTAYIVTLYRGYNYGSVLQCYALQQVISKLGIKTFVLDVQSTGIRWKIKRLYNNFKFYISCLKYPERKIAFQGVVKNAGAAGKGILDDSKEKFERFIKEEIRIKRCSYSELEKIANRDDCVACISGSDQVWGTAVKYLNSIHFLTFAPANKRYSYAASFGSEVIPKWYAKELRKYLCSFRRISIRENSALRILDALGIENGEVLVDPTLLLAEKEWTLFEKRPDNVADDFEFMYFLNTPSLTAINHISSLRRNILCYVPFKKIEEFKIETEEISLSPEEFVWMIHNCKRLYTDSFHGVAFACVFHKEFYVYQRQYVGVMDQSSRVMNILAHLKLGNQLITEVSGSCIPDYKLCDVIISKDRERSYSYLKEIMT